MTKDEFVKLMKEKAIEISSQNEKKSQLDRKTSSNIKVPSSNQQSKKLRNIKEDEDNEDANDEDEVDQLVNEEFKDVIRSVIYKIILATKSCISREIKTRKRKRTRKEKINIIYFS